MSRSSSRNGSLGFLLTILCVAQQCTERFMDFSFVRYNAESIGTTTTSKNTVALNNAIMILQEYQFNCSQTKIISLVLGIDVRSSFFSKKLIPSVQIFRSTTDDTNQYTAVPGTERFIYYSNSNASNNGVFEYRLDPPIPALRGDLLAVSQPSKSKSYIRIYITKGQSEFVTQKFPFGSKTIHLLDVSSTKQMVLVYPFTDGYCINSLSSINSSIIIDKGLTIAKSGAMLSNKQYLFPDIIFTCNGAVTKWIFGAVIKNTTSHFIGLPELQIWQKIGPKYYIKRGSNSIENITMISTNLNELIPQSPLQFEEGDAFGIYVPNESETTLNLYTLFKTGRKTFKYNTTEGPLIEINERGPYIANFPLVAVEISISSMPAISTTTFLLTETNNSTTKYLPIQSSESHTKIFSTKKETTASMNKSRSTLASSDASTMSTFENSSTTNSPKARELVPLISASLSIAITMLVATVISVLVLIWWKIMKRKQAAENEENTNNPVYEEIDYEMVIDPSSRVPVASDRRAPETNEDEAEYI